MSNENSNENQENSLSEDDIKYIRALIEDILNDKEKTNLLKKSFETTNDIALSIIITYYYIGQSSKSTSEDKENILNKFKEQQTQFANIIIKYAEDNKISSPIVVNAMYSILIKYITETKLYPMCQLAKQIIDEKRTGVKGESNK
jgi:hypothetical protein